MSKVDEYKRIQFDKIIYFCSQVKIDNIYTAERYLNDALWNEKLAVQNYINRNNKKHINNSNSSNNKIKGYENNQNNKIQNFAPISKTERKNFENIEKVNENNEIYIPLKITNIIDEHKYNNGPNSESLIYIKNKLKSVKLEFYNFLKETKDRVGIILIYDENIFNTSLKVKIEEIRKHALYSIVNENYIIFPVLNNSPIGKELSRQFVCINYPSCLFCEYKKKEQLCVTKRMDGVFDVSFFYDCIPFEKKKVNSNSSKNNVKIDKKNNIPKNENDNNIDVIDNINMFINKQRKLNFNDDYNFDKPYKNKKENNQINNNLNDMNQKNEFNNNSKNNNRYFKEDFEDKNKNENFNEVKQNNKKYNKAKTENYIQENLDDYYMGNSIGFLELIKQISNEQEGNPNNRKNNNNLNNNHLNNENPKQNEMNNPNKNNNKNYLDKYDKDNPFINKNDKPNNIINQNYINNHDNYAPFINEKGNENINKENNIMADSIFGLSDGQILAKRENEIRELERQQLEKDKKEEEEKRKILEEEKRLKKLNKKYEYESKIAKMILSEEPEDGNPDACHIKFRHPDGEKIIERRFLKTDKISSLYDYVKSIGREIFMEEDAFDFELIGGFPPKSLENKKNNTLEDEGMFPNFILQIREK